MVPALLCHIPSGSSTNQFLHYLQLAKYGHFGPYLKGTDIPHDFPLHLITAPLSIHYSTSDTLADPDDVERLLPKLTGSIDLFTQKITELFNHVDFAWGIHANKIVYKRILDFFKKHEN